MRFSKGALTSFSTAARQVAKSILGNSSPSVNSLSIMFDLLLLSSGSGINGWKTPDLSKAHLAGLVLLLVARHKGRGNAEWTPTWHRPAEPILIYILRKDNFSTIRWRNGRTSGYRR